MEHRGVEALAQHFLAEVDDAVEVDAGDDEVDALVDHLRDLWAPVGVPVGDALVAEDHVGRLVLLEAGLVPQRAVGRLRDVVGDDPDLRDVHLRRQPGGEPDLSAGEASPWHQDSRLTWVPAFGRIAEGAGVVGGAAGAGGGHVASPRSPRIAERCVPEKLSVQSRRSLMSSWRSGSRSFRIASTVSKSIRKYS